jgi:hypothetical protein
VASDSRADIADGETQGLLLALEALGADESALEALDDTRREACIRTWQALRAQDEAARARTMTAWRAEAVTALPAGLSRLHGSWIEEALAGERAEVVAAIRGKGATDEMLADETGRALARLAFAWLLPLCESSAGPLAERLCELPFEALLLDVTRRGARVVGRSLAGASPALRARAMASAGEPWAQEIAAGSMETVSPEARAAALAMAGAAGVAEARTPRDRMLAIGLGSLKTELTLEDPGSTSRVAGRLPAPLGRALIGW